MNDLNNYLKLLVSTILLFLTGLQASAQAMSIDVESKLAASIALKTAIEDANTRLHHYQESSYSIALIQTSEDKNGRILKQQFTPNKDQQDKMAGTWKTIRADAEFNQSIDVSNDILFESTNFDIAKAKLIEETNSAWIFRLPNTVNVDSDSSNEISTRDMEKIDDAITENLFTEMTIDKEHSKIKGLKIYALTSFSPSFMVTIEKFEIRLGFDEAWADGPIIRKNMTKHITGKMGWLINIDELITMKLSNIQKYDLATLAKVN